MTTSTVHVELSNTGISLLRGVPNSIDKADTKSPAPSNNMMFCHTNGLVLAFASSSSAAPTPSIMLVSAFVHALNFLCSPIAHKRNITYNVAHIESITSAYAIVASSTPIAA